MTATAAPAADLWVGTSWKMTKTLAEASAYAAVLVRELDADTVPPGVRPFVLPPHTALATVRDALPGNSPVLVGAQDAHWEPDGAVTGAVSMRQVRDAGASLVAVGHSERRRRMRETDEVVAWKVRAAAEAGMVPLLCVGEPAPIRESGRHLEFVCAQVRAGLAEVPGAGLPGLLVAYEPVWSIGDSGTAARSEQVRPVVDAIREVASDLVPPLPDGAPVPILYGGSVALANAEALLESGVDGLFVGRAAWQAADFVRLVHLVTEGRLQEAS